MTRRANTGVSVADMPLTRMHLVDTSAWSKAHNDSVFAKAFDDSARRGLVATCDMVALELLRSARDGDRFTHQAKLLTALYTCPVTEQEMRRARQVQAELAAAGKHRGVKPADLLIAATAEGAELPLLHYDHDYDLIASVTGQQVYWLAEPGSLA